jgi:hypothetical protein
MFWALWKRLVRALPKRLIWHMPEESAKQVVAFRGLHKFDNEQPGTMKDCQALTGMKNGKFNMR